MNKKKFGGHRMKKARKVLEELLNTGIKGTFTPTPYAEEKIDQALKELKELMPSSDQIADIIVDEIGFLAQKAGYTDSFEEACWGIDLDNVLAKAIHKLITERLG